MVELKRRFRGVKQNLNMARTAWNKNIYKNFWKILKRRHKKESVRVKWKRENTPKKRRN